MEVVGVELGFTFGKTIFWLLCLMLYSVTILSNESAYTQDNSLVQGYSVSVKSNWTSVGFSMHLWTPLMGCSAENHISALRSIGEGPAGWGVAFGSSVEAAQLKFVV